MKVTAIDRVTRKQIGEGGELRGSVGEKISGSSKKYQQKNSESKPKPSVPESTSQNSNETKIEAPSTVSPPGPIEPIGEKAAATTENQVAGTTLIKHRQNICRRRITSRVRLQKKKALMY